MKNPLLLLAAAGVLVAVVAVPNDAQAGHISLNMHIGVPGPAYRPRVVYAPVIYPPVIAYRQRVLGPPPSIYHGPAYRQYYPAYRHHYYERSRGYASAYPRNGDNRRIAEVQVNPRLGR